MATTDSTRSGLTGPPTCTCTNTNSDSIVPTWPACIT